ncbi:MULTISPECIES: hypothetical protein [unclassified Streptomyces]|uniref:hypothetical protein n=1 Tax=unclassified Streptomyces TaxID=2593676 RepID=UPI0014897B12|nr:MULTISPECIES: hypothetical protein [unclassified Streptomyces]
MTGPSSAPRGEHTPAPGATWNTELVSLGETVVDLDDDESPFGWRELDPPPRPNRATRRAAARAARRKQ